MGPLKRSGPPARRTPLKRGKALRSRRRIKPMSERTRDQLDERAIVRAEVLARDRGCVAKDLVPEVECCGGEDVDEITPRGVKPGAHLDAAGCQTLCRCHHIWKTEHAQEAARRGLRRWSWDDAGTSPQGGPREPHP